MNHSSIDDLVERLKALENDLEKEFEKRLGEKQKQFNYNIEQGKVRFEQGIKALQKKAKVGIWHYLSEARLGHIASAPIIYSIIVPFIILDIFVTLYQHICFRIYGVPRVIRSKYIIIDRQRLPYLNTIEKINCIYCGYGNGLIAYVREVGARTEQYWCPIKHARRSLEPHRLEKGFVDFGDAENYKIRLKVLQNELIELNDSDSKPTQSRADNSE